jgi:hypothetical protein
MTFIGELEEGYDFAASPNFGGAGRTVGSLAEKNTFKDSVLFVGNTTNWPKKLILR